MTTASLTRAAILCSASAVGHLAFRDPKRRRAFGEPARERPARRALAWTAAYLPGVLLAALEARVAELERLLNAAAGPQDAPGAGANRLEDASRGRSVRSDPIVL